MWNYWNWFHSNIVEMVMKKAQNMRSRCARGSTMLNSPSLKRCCWWDWSWISISHMSIFWFMGMPPVRAEYWRKISGTYLFNAYSTTRPNQTTCQHIKEEEVRGVVRRLPNHAKCGDGESVQSLLCSRNPSSTCLIGRSLWCYEQWSWSDCLRGIKRLIIWGIRYVWSRFGVFNRRRFFHLKVIQACSLYPKILGLYSPCTMLLI